MLAVLPPLGNLNGESSNKQQQEAEMESFSMILGEDDFADFSAGNLLDSIDFDDLICDSDVLPDLELDPDLLAEFSLSTGEDYCSDINTTTTASTDEKTAGGDTGGGQLSSGKDSESGLVSSSGLEYSGCISSEGDEEMVSKRDPDPAATDEVGLQSTKKQVTNARHAKPNKNSCKALGVSSKGTSKDAPSQGKRKVKVDWTPELHRRFVQAVEQLGVDKAVPSRILEIMGIDCLTRHNIASHLQKYRSHRKHLMAREAEAASWSQRRPAYAAGPMVGVGLGKSRDRVNPWLVPTVGFPPITPQPLHAGQGHRARPLHVWGHPSVDQTMRPLWPKHPPIQQPHPIWPSQAHQMPRDSPAYWHPQMRNGGLYPGAPCFPQPPLGTTMRFPAQTVQGIPPHAMYKVDSGIGVSAGSLLLGPLPLPDFHPSAESVDAAIGDVLSKPWLPLPIGLKPPELESVMGELQRNGVPNIPPPSA